MSQAINVLALLVVSGTIGTINARSLFANKTYQLGIIGGDVVNPPHSRPEIVALKAFKGEYSALCGGTLLSSKYVLTAAHCVNGIESMKVLLGAHNKKNPEAGAKFITATGWKIHESYNSENDDNDIAIVELSEEVPIGGNIGVVTLPPDSDAGKKYEGRSTKAYGWGSTSEKGPTSDLLKVVNMPILDYDYCKEILSVENHHLPDNDICTQASKTRGTCEGDSGGPLYVEERKPVKRSIQIGIASTGFACESNVPNVFVQVADYLPWIRKNAKLN